MSVVISFEHTDFKNVIFEKIHWAHSEDAEVAEVKQPRNPFVTSEGAQGIFSKITFLKSVHPKENDEACLGFLVKFFTKSVHRGEMAYNTGSYLTMWPVPL